MSKMKPTTVRNRASAVVIALLGGLLFLAYACSAKADTMLGSGLNPSFMGVPAGPGNPAIPAPARAKRTAPAPAPAAPTQPERWVITVIATVDGKVSAAATYGDAVYSSSSLCESAVKADKQLNTNAASALDALVKDNPGAKIAIVIACAMKVDTN